jgi:hypothetical protein
MKSKTKKQLIEDIENLQQLADKRLEKLRSALSGLSAQQHVARASAGKLRFEVHNLDLDNDLRAKLIKMIDNHINEL